MAKKDQSIKSSILIIFLIIFFALSFLRTFYNESKLFTEERAWIGLSEEQKKIKAYGSLYVFSKKVSELTANNATILFITTDVRAYYLAKYFLYPRRVTVVTGNTTSPIGMTEEYVAIFFDNCDYLPKQFMKTTRKVYKKEVYTDKKKCHEVLLKK